MKTTQSTQAHISRLSEFRHQAYSFFEKRGDVLFELMDAIVQTEHANSFAELSLASACTRQWHSQYKALQEGSFKLDGLRLVCLGELPARKLLHFSLDVMNVRRMHSESLKERTFCHGAKREVGGNGMIIGLPFSLLAFVDKRNSSWAPTVHTQRVKPKEKAVTVAVKQIKWLAPKLPPDVDAAVSLDGSYGNIGFFMGLQGIPIFSTARMRDDRTLYRIPSPVEDQEHKARGRPAKYGAEFSFNDSLTWHQADEVLEFEDSGYGQVRMQLWGQLRFEVSNEIVDIDVVRCEIHLDKKKPPKAHWYGVHNGTKEATTLARVFDCLCHRWPIEPANRFRKERLHAELPKVRRAKSSDVWMTLLQLIEWQLYLWREVATDERMPWQKPLPKENLTPSRVIRSLSNNLSLVGNPVQETLPRGKSPGWETGRIRKRPLKYKLKPKKRKRSLKKEKNE